MSGSNRQDRSGVPKWQRRFEGRHKELATLKDAWRRVVENGETIIVPIIGQPGVGKTRLVQQLYSWISREYDEAEPLGYWPDDLTAAHSLEFIPNMRRCQPLNLFARPMPFLWWGARWHDPTIRNRPAETGEGFEGSWPMLKAHAAVGLAVREAKHQRNENLGNAIESLLKTSLAAIPAVSALPSAYEAARDVLKLLRGIATSRELEHQAQVRQRMQVALGSLDEEFRQSVMTAFSHFLRPPDDDRDPVPAVLFLDDIQWCTPEDVVLLEQLIRGPIIEGVTSSSKSKQTWPVLVLATYWPENWNKHKGAEPGARKTARDLLSLLADHARVVIKPPLNLDVFRQSELVRMIREALPGVTDEQAARLDDACGGNPRLCVELLKRIASDRRMFVDFDPLKPLRPESMDRIEDLVRRTGLYGVVQERLENYPTMREVLAAGSLQGPRFLVELIAEIAELLPIGEEDKANAVRVSIRHSVDPEALAEPVGSTSCQFPEAVYFKVCRDHAEQDPEFAAELAESVRARLRDWVSSRRDEEMDPLDAKCMLTLAADTLKPDALNDADAWQDAMFRLVCKMESDGDRIERLEERLSQLLASRPPAEHAEHWTQRYGVMDILPIYAALSRVRPADALEIAEAVLACAQDSATNDRESLSDLLVSLNQVGRALSYSNPGRAIELFEKSLAIGRDIVERYGSDMWSLSDVCMSLDLVGNVVLHSDPRRALDLYEESLAIRHDIVDRHGADAKSLRNLSWSQIQVGDAVRHCDPNRAIELYEDSLAICRNIMDCYGVDAHSRRDLKVAIDRVGDMVLQSDPGRAIDLYEESLTISRELIDRYGADAQSLRDLSVSLLQVGGAVLHLNPRRSHDLYEESLVISREIVARYGTDAQSLRDLSISLNRVGNAVIHSDPERAIELNEESLANTRELVERYGADAQSLRDLSVSLNRVGAAVCNSDPGRAICLYEESLAISREILARYGADAQSLRDLTVPLGKLGLAVLHSNPSRAVELFGESLAIDREIVARYGADAKSLRGLLASLDRIGVATLYSDPGHALEFFTESISISREIVERYGADGQSLRDLSLSLSKVGNAVRRSDPGEALRLFEESLAIDRETIVRYGADAQSLHDLFVSLNNVGIAVHFSDSARALELFGESLTTSRKIIEKFGADARSLRDLVVSLTQIGIATRDSDPRRALPHFEESLAISRDIVERYGVDAQSLRDLAYTMWFVGDLMSDTSLLAESSRNLRTVIDEWGCRREDLPRMRVFLERRSRWMDPANEGDWCEWWKGLTGELTLP